MDPRACMQVEGIVRKSLAAKKAKLAEAAKATSDSIGAAADAAAASGAKHIVFKVDLPASMATKVMQVCLSTRTAR